MGCRERVESMDNVIRGKICTLTYGGPIMGQWISALMFTHGVKPQFLYQLFDQGQCFPPV